MKKIYLFLMLILLSSSVLSHELDVIGKVHADIDVINDYNEGVFRIGEEIPFIYHFEILNPPDKNISVGYENFEEEEVFCENFILSSGDEIYYSTCSVFPNETGIYTVMFFLDDEEYYIEAFEVIDAFPDVLTIILLSIGIIIISIGLILLKDKGIFGIGYLILTSGLIKLTFVYDYVLGNELTAGIIGVVTLIMFIVMYFTFMNPE